MQHRRSSNKKTEGPNKTDRYTVIIPIASKRNPLPAEGIKDPQLAKAIESQFYVILPDLPPVNQEDCPPEAN